MKENRSWEFVGACAGVPGFLVALLFCFGVWKSGRLAAQVKWELGCALVSLPVTALFCILFRRLRRRREE